jgi:hypothetical protein
LLVQNSHGLASDTPHADHIAERHEGLLG